MGLELFVQVHCLSDERIQSTLDNPISLQISNGSLSIVSGHNGCGKTSLLRCLAGLTLPENGSIERHVPFSYLGPNLGLKQLSTVKSCLKWLIGDAISAYKLIIDMFPVLKDYHFDRSIYTLSSGQQLALRMGIMVLQAHKLWLLDEPFRFLDIHNSNLLQTFILNHIKDGGSVVMAIHEVDLAKEMLDLRQKINVSENFQTLYLG